MDPLVALINEVVNNNPLTPLNNNNSIPRVIRDGYEPIKLEGNDKVFSPIISNKDNSNTKKTQQKNNSNPEGFIEHEFSSKELDLEVLSQQSSNQPPSLFPTHTAVRQLSTITEQTELLTTIQKSSELESKLLRPTATLSRSSSSDGSVSLKDSEPSDLSVSREEKFDKKDNCVAKQSSRVYTSNRDILSNTLEDPNIKTLAVEQAENICEGGEQITSDNSTITTNIVSNTTHILSNNLNSSGVSLSLDSVHSEKSILGDIYNTIKQGQSTVAIPSPPSPSPSPTSSDRYPNTSSIKNIKEGRAHREDRYPSPGTYFSHKSGPMGDLSGRLSPNKRVSLILTLLLYYYYYFYFFFYFFYFGNLFNRRDFYL
jgi:hypothetical protein